jgi:hypothetical protein
MAMYHRKEPSCLREKLEVDAQNDHCIRTILVASTPMLDAFWLCGGAKSNAHDCRRRQYFLSGARSRRAVCVECLASHALCIGAIVDPSCARNVTRARRRRGVGQISTARTL